MPKKKKRTLDLINTEYTQLAAKLGDLVCRRQVLRDESERTLVRMAELNREATGMRAEVRRG